MSKLPCCQFAVAVLLISALLAPSAVGAEEQPVVHAILFWMEGCQHCHFVLEQVLPPLQDQYGDQLDILLVELADVDSVNLLYQAAASFGIPKESVGVPFLVIGDRVLVGSEQIPAQLPDLIEAHLASGGLDYPDIPGLVDLLPISGSGEIPPDNASELDSESLDSNSTSPKSIDIQSTNPFLNGFSLAFAVIAAMIAALVYVAISFLRRAAGNRASRRAGWRDYAIPILAAVGLIVSGYLAYVEMQSVQAVCGPVGDCNAVQSSPYARLFGILPLGILGLFGYAAILTAWYIRRFHPRLMKPYDFPLIFGMAFSGTIFSLYLTYLELFVIQAVCLWCISSAVVMTLLMLASLAPARQYFREMDWKATAL